MRVRQLPDSIPNEVVILLLVGYIGFFTVRAFTRFDYARKSLRWRPVDGVITRSMLDVEEYRSGGRKVRYRADIKYSYRIGSKELEGDRVYPGSNDWSGTEARPQQLLDMYQLGSKVRVYTDPARPEVPVLRRGERGAAWRDLLIAYGPLAMMAIVYLLMGLALRV